MAGLYLHIPFCKRVCAYCDFYKSADLRPMKAVVEAMHDELRREAGFLPAEQLRTIYFGGGTPSLLPPEELEEFIAHAAELFDCTVLEECTVEANPDDLTPDYLRRLARTRVDRLSIGVQSFDARFRATLKAKPDEDSAEDAALPELAEGQIFETVTASVSEHYTTPPKPYTEDSLLSAMENAGKEDMPEDAERQGLGTPATRAAMIEKLLSAGFVERKGKSLVPTKDGINLAVILPDMLKSPLLTAEWESRLTEIAKGSDDPQSFMQGIEDMTRELVKQYSHITEDGKKLFAPEKKAVGICPRCKSPVYEGKKNFYCSDRSCRFVMWKNDKFFESRRTVFSKKIAAALLKDGKAKVKGLYSERTGKTYDGTVLLCDTGEKYVNYRIEQRK